MNDLVLTRQEKFLSRKMKYAAERKQWSMLRWYIDQLADYLQAREYKK